MSKSNSVRPAMENLHSEQREFVERCLAGVETRWGQLELLHDWAVLSAGRVNPDLLAVVGGTRSGWHSNIFIREVGIIRTNFVGRKVMPGLNAAHGVLWQKATEYGSSPPDAESEESLAMRPAVEELWEEQREVLRRGLEGFDGMEDALEWSHDVSRASLGHADSEWLEKLTALSSVGRPFYFPPYEEDTVMRSAGLAKYVLPWFVEAVREQVEAASEQPEEKEPEPVEYELGEDLLGEDTRDGRG